MNKLVVVALLSIVFTGCEYRCDLSIRYPDTFSNEFEGVTLELAGNKFLRNEAEIRNAKKELDEASKELDAILEEHFLTKENKSETNQ